MSFIKDYMAEVDARGYDDSDKSICASCVGDKFFYHRIRSTGTTGLCSFCNKKTRKVLPMNDIMATIATVVNRDYLPAEGNVIYDSEEKKWWDSDNVMAPYEFVFEELNQFLESDNDEFLQELVDKLAFEDRMSAYNFSFRQEEIDMEQWNEYCKLVKSTPLSAEQIVSMIKAESHRNDLPEDLEAIQGTLEMVHGYCEELGLIRTINSKRSKKTRTPIYRCVNFFDKDPKYAGLKSIPATLVGTAPAKVVQDSRMSEKGDMMFYGADDKNTAIIEVGRNIDHPDYPASMGTFYSNKQFRIMDLSYIDPDKLPSIFDVDNADKRSAWFFLNEFMERISQRKEDDKDFYKPTQVFTKYIQRNTDLKGLKYKSSKASGNCYTLFVVNRDCLDNGDKVDGSRNQLIMESVEQVEFPVAYDEPIKRMHYDENGNGIYDLTSEEKELLEEHKKFYFEFFRYGNQVLDAFPDPIKEYELTVFSMYYRILELLDTLEVMTIESLVNSGLLIVRSLLEAVAMLCYVLSDDQEIEKRAIVWQMMDIKRTALDETEFFNHMSGVNCYKKYVGLIQNATKKYDNWYSYCEGKPTSQKH